MSDHETDDRRVGSYRLERHLATGGMADIWLATQEGPEGFSKEVVLKRIRGLRAGDDAFRTMFLDEARLTARLNHPNIVQVHELGEDDDDFFVAMEYVEGDDLADLLERHGKLPWHLALHIVEQILLALIFVAELEDDGQPLDVVHRDISPSNILLSKTGHVKLADFGVAKAMSNHHRTQTGATKGKLSYMSPEQVRADDLDARSDLFALGINLYEMLTGELPFGDGVRALHAIQEESYPALEPSPDLPASVIAFLDRALAKDRENRFESAEAMHDAAIEIFRNEAAHVSRRDVAELVVAEPLDATRPATPAAKATTPERPSVKPTTTPTAVVGPGPDFDDTETVVTSPPSPERAPTRLPWILVGVLLGVIIAGGASAIAIVNGDGADDDPVEAAAVEPDAGTQADEEPAAAKPAKTVKPKKKAKRGKKPDEKPKAEKPKKRDDKKAKKRKRDRDKAEKKRRRDRKALEKKLELERKRLEKEAKKLDLEKWRKALD